MKITSTKEFFGTATVGEKGQVVIPSEARASLGMKKGEKLLVFGMDKDMLMLVKFSQLEKFATHLSRKLEAIQGIIGGRGKK